MTRCVSWITKIHAVSYFSFLVTQNDLNLDHFCRNIIQAELLAITSVPVPNPSEWAFVRDNDCVFGTNGTARSPEDWIIKGERAMRNELERGLVPQ